ncbi:MAG: lipopolysaccharide biosynthesis protein [Saccharofermentanales bacterium]|jgi:O-antigen/teichoic acid export membrane protein
MRYRLSSKVKGIARVSFANLLSLAVSLITSFLLPYFISIEDYGYWQLFILFTGYVGFFAFGFNDGVHLNYATYSYNATTASKFSTFKNMLFVMSAIETLVLMVFLIVFIGPEHGKFYTFLFAILNILPVLINGLFTYMNQATMRFKQYAWGNMIDKVIFVILMVFMLFAGCKSYIYYIAAYTASRYLVIGYHYISSRLVFTEKPIPFSILKPEIIHNFTSGFALMLATLLNSSIIVGSRLLIEREFGIVEFGAYSFANHTLVIASQFISAIASVFYPIMKRCKANELENAYKVFDKASTILSSVLLISYYMVAIVINLLYMQYSFILEYFAFVYPLFIFQCKSNLLIVNIYKVKGQPRKLVARNATGIVIHLVFAYSAYWIFGTVHAIAVAVLASYCIWYYLSQAVIYHESGWKLQLSIFWDLAVTSLFILINTTVDFCYLGDFYIKIFIECFAFISAVIIIAFLLRKRIMNTLHETAYILKD